MVMETSPIAAVSVPVNPLVGEFALTAVTVVTRVAPGGTAHVQGRVVAPGLAVAPLPKRNPKEPDRYGLIHMPTGLAVIPAVCGMHVLQGVDLTLKLDVNWRIADRQVVVDVAKAAGFMDVLTEIRFACDGRWCKGDGPEPPSADVRCTTCGWAWSDYEEYSEFEWPLTVDEAKQLAGNHECEPHIEIRVSETAEWTDGADDPGRAAPAGDLWAVTV